MVTQPTGPDAGPGGANPGPGGSPGPIPGRPRGKTGSAAPSMRSASSTTRLGFERESADARDGVGRRRPGEEKVRRPPGQAMRIRAAGHPGQEHDEGVPCKFFRQGYCKDGEACVFKHVGPVEVSPPTCCDRPRGPVLRCANGHRFCADCCAEIVRRGLAECPMCRVPRRRLNGPRRAR